MHEFGHVLHDVLSRADYNPEAGTSVKRDFVEAPSQMFEEWARREQPLELFKQVCPDCPHLTHDEIERLEAARNYGQGMRYARQWLYASFDMALSIDPQPPLAAVDEARARHAAGPRRGHDVPGVLQPHRAATTRAGYYGYMWSRGARARHALALQEEHARSRRWDGAIATRSSRRAARRRRWTW